MDETRFRFWSKITEKMSPVISLRELCYEKFETSLDPMSDKYVVPLRYTGLSDMDGREIFQGDVLKGEGVEHLYEAVWDKEYVCFKFVTKNAVSLGYVPRLAASMLRIVGNVYENN